MSTATSPAPLLVDTDQTEEATEAKAEVSPEEAFKNAHRANAELDCKHAKLKGLSQLIVTPARFVLRHQHMAHVRVDLLSRDCEQIKWLKSLYYQYCPEGMYLMFDVKTEYDAATPLSDVLEDLHLLFVYFRR